MEIEAQPVENDKRSRKRVNTKSKRTKKENIEEPHLEMEVEITDISEQKDVIKNIMSSCKLKEGQDFYVVPCVWWNSWKVRVNFDDEVRKKKKQRNVPNPGRIQNDVLLEAGVLKKGLVENQDVVVLPKEAWDHLQSW